MYTEVRGSVYLNIYSSANIHAENVTMNMTKSIGGFFYFSA